MRTLSRNVIGVLAGVALLFAPVMSAAPAETPPSTYASIAHPAPSAAPDLDSAVVDPYDDHGILPNERMLQKPNPLVGAAIVGLFILLVLAVGAVLSQRYVRSKCPDAD